jgi:hypothetical protein
MNELQEQFPLRKELEFCVCAFNSILKSVVRFMSLPVLLNNCHPLYRIDYARKLYKEGYLSADEAQNYFKLTIIDEL